MNGKNDDKFRATLEFASRDASTDFIRKYDLDVVDNAVLESAADALRVKSESYELTLLLDESEIESLKADGFAPQVFANMSEIGRMRQEEVGKGNRYEDGKNVPRGLGRKIKEGR